MDRAENLSAFLLLFALSSAALFAAVLLSGRGGDDWRYGPDPGPPVPPALEPEVLARLRERSDA
jgi:hypothetical protein